MRLTAAACSGLVMLGCGAKAFPRTDDVAAGGTGEVTTAAAAAGTGTDTPAIMLSRTQVCVRDNPHREPFDTGDMPVPASRPDGPALPPPRPMLDLIVEQCQTEGGSDCDPATFIAKEAAVCIAQQAGLQPGIGPWQVSMVFHSGHKRVVWNVSTVLSDNGIDGVAGRGLVIDAVEASVIDGFGWSAVP